MKMLLKPLPMVAGLAALASLTGCSSAVAKPYPSPTDGGWPIVFQHQQETIARVLINQEAKIIIITAQGVDAGWRCEQER